MPNWKKVIVSGSDAALNSLTVTAGVTGSLQGTASWATNATNATTATNATNVAVTDTTTGTGPYYVMFADGTTGNRAVRVDSNTLTFNATTNTLTVTSSFASTASYVNTLNQAVLITGSATIGATSAGALENTLTLGARDATSEGGQLGLNAPGGSYISASFIDLYQNRLRVLKGTNASSTAEVASWNMPLVSILAAAPMPA